MSKFDLIKDFSYPDPDDLNLLSKIFKKREFYYYNVEKRKKLESYDEIQKYRDLNCKKDIKEPKEHQQLIKNFINPNTPYKGMILMYGVGSGKTMAAIGIAEQFKEQIKKYNTKIYVLVPGPNTRENFKKELIETTGNEYLKNKEIFTQLSKTEINQEKKNAIYNALQYYKIISYKTFYKKVLGEKIAEKKLVKGDKKIKVLYKRTEEGEYEREQVIDRIINMNNTLLIIDEAHNITGNEYGEALKKIIKNSENLRIVLLTATPMINLADEIIDLLNFIRPQDDMIQRDKIFTPEKNYLMQIKSQGLEYLQEKAKGYISFYRGSIPYTFADRIDKGNIPEGMLFTPIIKCYMDKFQYDTYIETTHKFEDTLDRASSAASNFVFPGLDKARENLIGYYSTEGLNIILSQLQNEGSKIRELINKKLFNNKLSKEDEKNFIFENNKKSITGLILQLQYIKKFSTKFYTIINNLNNLVNDNACTAFVYSNLVKAGGMELFAEALIQNGYLEYQDESSNYDIKDDTRDYKTGLSYSEFKKKKMDLVNFRPSKFLLITGGTEETEELPEIKQKIVQDIFNSIDNVNGKYIKFILGSRVMGEGVTLKNCKEVHIIDVFYNIPKIEQVIGRVIRMCVHQDVINDNYRFPEVNVYRYVVAIDDKQTNRLSTDEILYQKAELKYLTIKKVERALKEISIDCPLLLNTNIFPEEIEKYKKCAYPTLENIKAKKLICPALCDFKPCAYKCQSTNLNKNYWDEENMTYKKLNKKDIDYNTFNDELGKSEIISIKNKIKDLYKFKHVYIYNEIYDQIKKSFTSHQSELFEEYFLEQSLKNMMPITENDFNNFTDIIYDKYNRPGYIIQRGIYFIFQPFNENEDVPLYYKQFIDINYNNKNSIDNYVKQNYSTYIDKVAEVMPKFAASDDDKIRIIKEYNFEDTLDYYENRDENFIVGIIDKNLNKLASTDMDLFKIRPPRAKILDKKRGTGIPTFKGAVCWVSKDKNYLIEIFKKLPFISQEEIHKIQKFTKENICEAIKNKLLYLEKYSTSEDNNKITYVMIPKDHPIYPFPYNLEDRIKFIIKNIKSIIHNTSDIIVKKKKDKNNNIYYELNCNHTKNLENNKEIMVNNGFTYHKQENIWSYIVN